MKKLSIIFVGLVFMTMAYAGNTDLTNTGTPNTFFSVKPPGATPPVSGPRAPAVLVDVIDISPINTAGYTWGLAYDWDRDGLWITQFSNTYNKMHCIQKTSPFTLIDSVTLGSGVPSYRLGIGYVGSNTMRMAAYSNTIYTINMTTGVGTTYRTLPWSGCEGLDANSVDDAIYASDWTANACAWAKPAQTGSWTTWSVAPYPSGMTGGFSATASPSKIFMVDEVTSGVAHIFQYVATAGVPNTTPESTWTVDASQTQSLTADAAFDGQYVYILDQSVPRQIFVYDVGIQLNDTVRWDFETGHQGWVNSNGQPFPDGWDVQSSQYEPAWSPPASEDSSYWVDSDASGGLVEDTALSPVLVPHAATTKWFKYGFSFDLYAAGEFMEVGIKYFNGSAWTVVPLTTYSADINPRWDSFDVSAYATYPRIQVYYYYSGDYGWWAAFDNVSLNGELYVAAHDIRASSIDVPGSRIPPSTPIAPIATFANGGNNTEDFAAYFVVDSAGTVVYNQTVNVTGLVPAADTAITFPNWTPGASDGIVYNLTAYNVLAGDINPANDTVRSTTSTSLVSDWTQCADRPTAEECQATGYDPVGDKIYTFGGYHGDDTYYNVVYQYDPVANTWATMAPMPGVNDWIDASYVNGKFYVMGGYGNASIHNTNYIYDIAGNSWSTGAVMPQGRIAGGQVIFNDSLIYYLGGYNGSGPTTNVQVYNTYTNTWTTGTALPAADMMHGCAITGDTIWLVGGYSGACYTNLYYGVINPTTNETITWSTGPALAVPNFNNGATQMIKNGTWYLYIVGGFENASTITNKAWEFNVATSTWTPLPDYPFTVTRNDILVAREGHDEIYVNGGDNSGGWTENSQCWKLMWNAGAQEKPGTVPTTAFGFAPSMNPIRDRVTLAYSTPVTGSVDIRVYDGMGRLVKVLVQGVQAAGYKTVAWDLNDESGLALRSGVYFVRLEANGQTSSQKLVLVK